MFKTKQEPGNGHQFWNVLEPPDGHIRVWHPPHNNVYQLKTWSSPIFNDTVLKSGRRHQSPWKHRGLDTETFLFHSHHLTSSSSTMSTWASDHKPSKPFWAFTGSNGGFQQQRETVNWQSGFLLLSGMSLMSVLGPTLFTLCMLLLVRDISR